MNRRGFFAIAATASLAGCSGLFGDVKNSRLNLTVKNDRPEPITVQVTVVGESGTTYEDLSDRVDSGVARMFEVVVGTEGRHVATVSGDEWRGQVAWHADRCLRFDGTVRVTPESVEVASECVQPR